MTLRTIDIVVRYSCGAYATNTVKTKRASSTMSARAAAEKLGLKLFGEGFHEVAEIDHDSASTSRWRIHGDNTGSKQ